MPRVNDSTARLFEAIKTAVPAVAEIEVGTFGQPSTVKVKPDTQQTAAQPTITAFDWSDTANQQWANGKARTNAAADIDDSRVSDDKKLRAALLVAVDEINILRAWLASFKTEVAAAASLADLKTRIATLPDTPARTTQQAYTAIKNKITSGAVD